MNVKYWLRIERMTVVSIAIDFLFSTVKLR